MNALDLQKVAKAYGFQIPPAVNLCILFAIFEILCANFEVPVSFEYQWKFCNTTLNDFFLYKLRPVTYDISGP